MRSAVRTVVHKVIIIFICDSREVGSDRRINAFPCHVKSPFGDTADNIGIGENNDEEEDGRFQDFDNVFFKAGTCKRVVESGRKNGDKENKFADKQSLADKERLKFDNFVNDEEEGVVNIVADFLPIFLSGSMERQKNKDEEKK